MNKLLLHTTYWNLGVKLELAATQFTRSFLIIFVLARRYLFAKAFWALNVGKKFFYSTSDIRGRFHWFSHDIIEVIALI
jgi:hypothetical protein